MSEERTGKELLDAMRPFMTETPSRSVMASVSTFALLAGVTAVALFGGSPWVRGPAAVLEGLFIVRAFILYHDFLHGAILRKSSFWSAFYAVYGVLVLTPPTVWRATHNYHHANNAKIIGSHIGSYATLTTKLWGMTTRGQRIMYRITRHPLNILLGVFTIFGLGMCLSPFLRSPKKHWDGLLALIVHVALAAALWLTLGPSAYFFGLFLPLAVACAAGGYLFYAQHNFPGIVIQPREEWDFVRAGLESSSYMPMGPIMAYFCGNIGFHHVHHLNPRIPFYRLPETMAALKELQHPHVTRLTPGDIFACFKLKLWDPEQGRMVGYAQAERAIAEAAASHPAAKAPGV